MSLRVLLIEPYYGGSHRAWVDSLRQYSGHNIDLLALPDQYWKWRMQGGAVSLARMYHERADDPDVILASDMFDLSSFRALTRRRTAALPTGLYFHENQLTYPQNTRQQHGYQYGFINYVSALSADAVYFNSVFHLDSFFDELPRMLKHFPDFNELQTIGQLRQRSSVLPLGVDLRRFDAYRTERIPGPPLILWNHRWDEDKNPAAFFKALNGLVNQQIAFRVALVGENVRQKPEEFEEARMRLGERVVRYGYVESFAHYARLLWQADYVVSTANQDFFGAAVAEAIYCGCVPLLANRLNYPALLPPEYHSACLFPGDDLLPLLSRHLRGEVAVNVEPLRQRIARFEWANLIDQYDEALNRLAQGR